MRKKRILSIIVLCSMFMGGMHIQAQTMSATIGSYSGSTFCEGAHKNFGLYAIVKEGEPPYTYEWTYSWRTDTTYGDFTSVSPDSSGIVKLVVKDANEEFPKRDTAYFEIEEIRVDVDFEFHPDNVCAQSTIKFTPDVHGGDPEYDYFWAFGDGHISRKEFAEHEYVTNRCDGMTVFPVQLTITDGNGCSASVSHDVSVVNTPRLNFEDIANDQPFKHCHDPSIEPPDFDVVLQNITQGDHPCIGNYTVDWGDGSPLEMNVTNFPITHTYTEVGAFKLTVTAENSADCDLSWSTFVYNQSTPAVGLETPGNTTGCAPKDFSFRLTGLDKHTQGTTYTWYFQDGTPPVVWNDDSVAVKDAITHRYTRSHCEFGLSSFGVVVIADNGCTDGVRAFVDGVLIETAPSASIGNGASDGTICTMESLILQNNTPTAYSTDCDTISSYYWDLGNGVTSNDAEPEVVWTDPGKYDIVLTADANNNCPASSDTFSVEVIAAPEANITVEDTSGCVPFTPVLDNNSTGESIGYLWKISPSSGYAFVNGTNKNSHEPSIQFSKAGTYEITFYVYNICDQKDSMIFDLHVFDVPEGELTGVDDLCISDPVLGPGVNYEDNGTPLTGLLWEFEGGSPATSNDEDPGDVGYASAGEYRVELSLTNQCGTTDLDEAFTLFEVPEIIVNSPLEICSANDLQIQGTIISNSTSYRWDTEGDGGFNSPLAQNPTYYMGSQDILNESVLLTITANGNAPCSPVSEEVLVNIQPEPEVFAGEDVSVCEGSPYDIIDAHADHNDRLNWSTTNGDGRFSDTRAMNPRYTPGANDLVRGWVELTLTATAIYPCTRVISDVIIITYDRKPVIDAGPDKEICEDGFVSVSATGSDYSGVYWFVENGEGTFDAPNEETTIFRLSNGYAADTVAIYIDAFGALNCPNSRDTLILNVVQLPVAEAGNEGIICENQTFRVNGASVDEAASFYWIVNGDGTLDDDYVLDPLYSPGAGDISEGSAVLTLVAEGNGPCTSVSDDVTVIIQRLPEADAGDDQDVCLDHPVPLNGNQLHGNAWRWSSLGTNPGTFDDPSNLITSYHPSEDDYLSGSVKLLLTVEPESPCELPSADTLEITFVEPPIVDAGPDAIICSSDFFTPDQASVLNSDTYHWESTGVGTFENGTSLNPTYLHAPQDVAEDSIQLVLISNSPTCPEVSDSLVLKITPYPVVDAGEDKIVCEEEDVTLADARTEHSNSVAWSTMGDGDFDEEEVLHTFYSPGEQDISNGFVKLFLTVYGQYPCDQPGKDSLLITIQKPPMVFAGDDAIIAQDEPYTIMDATEANTAGVQWKTLGGDGRFLDPFSVNATYEHGPNDLANRWVDLVIIGTPSAPCAEQHSDTMRLYITPRPDISAGEDQIICEGSDVEITTAYANEVSETWWTSNGTGSFINDKTLSPVYVPGTQDIIDREVILTLHANGESPLEDLEVVDHMVVTIYHNADVDLTLLDTACENRPYYLSDVTYRDVNEITWSSSGSGGFTQTTAPHPSYIFSSMDSEEDTLYLSVEVNSYAPCTFIDRDTMMIRLFHEPEASFIIDDTEGCGPHTTLLSNTSVGEELQFNWNFGNGLAETALQDPGSITFEQGRIADTTYTITLEASNRCNTSSATGQVIVKPVPITDFGMNVSWGCSPKEIYFNNVTTGLADSYTWKWGDGKENETEEQPGSHIFETGDRDTTYIVTLVSENECGIDSMQKSVLIFPNKVTAFFETDTTLGCAPLEVSFRNYSRGVLGDEPFLNWSWNFGDGNVDTLLHPVHVFEEPGVYTVKLVVNDTCSVDDYTTEIVVMGAPEVRFSTDRNAYCEHDTVFFSPQNMPLDEIAGVTWDFGDNSQGSAFNESHVYDKFGDYTVTLTARDIRNGCTASTSSVIRVNESPVAAFSIPDNDACQPLDLTFINESEGADYYAWDYGNGERSVDEHGTQVFKDSGLYTVRLFVSDIEGCSDRIEKSLRVHPKPVAAFDPSSRHTCFPPVDVSFNNLSKGADDYRWNFGNGASARSTNPMAHYSEYGDYEISLVVNNMYHCSDTAEMVYHVYHNPEADFKVDSTIGCDPFTVPFINLSEYGKEYYWQFGEHGFSGEKDPLYTFEGEGISTVSLLVIGEGGCRDSITREDFITTNPSPYASFEYTRINEIDTVQFHNYSAGAISYLWNFGDGEFSEDSDPWHRYLNYGIYNVRLTAVNEYNCTDTFYDSINFELFKGIFVPNAFSPASQLEDVHEFRAVGIGLVTYHLLIYDTWGNLLWETTKLDRGVPAEGWDGTFRGKPLEPDVYVWHLKEAVFKDGSSYDGERYGTITLIR